MKYAAAFHAAFTLIELSIVLVIIGLVVGGILTGRSLIESSAISAQIAQIQSYTTAATTFKTKYEYWPGDLPRSLALQFGLPTRSGATGYGDGNGQINSGGAAGCCNIYYGELGFFWVDLSAARMIGESFNTAINSWTGSAVDIGSTQIEKYIPAAKIGNSNYLYIWADGFYSSNWYYLGPVYFGLSRVSAISGSSNWGTPDSSLGLSVAQAYAIDKKMDDGLPDYGKVVSIYVDGQNFKWATTGTTLNPYAQIRQNVAITASSTTCYDNGGVSTKTKTYTLSNDANINCALSFRFIE